MSLYEKLGEAATQVLVSAAKEWPKAIGLQSSLAFDVKKYQTYKQAGKEVGSWFNV